MELRKGAVVVPTTTAGLRDFVRIVSDDYLGSLIDPSSLYLSNSKRP